MKNLIYILFLVSSITQANVWMENKPWIYTYSQNKIARMTYDPSKDLPTVGFDKMSNNINNKLCSAVTRQASKLFEKEKTRWQYLNLDGKYIQIVSYCESGWKDYQVQDYSFVWRFRFEIRNSAGVEYLTKKLSEHSQIKMSIVDSDIELIFGSSGFNDKYKKARKHYELRSNSL